MKHKALPIEGLTLQKVVRLGESSDYENDAPEGRQEVGNLEEANIVTSKVAGKSTHKVILDIDLPASLVPSSTEGHYHLYIDKEVEWDDYVNVLEALASAGIIEYGYADASIERGYTALRLPWIRKGDNVNA